MPNTVNFYLSKGFDKKMAEYFANGRKTITSVVPNKDFTLTLIFDNNEKRLFDMKSLIQKNTVFEQLNDYQIFNKVYLDENHIVCWDKNPNVDSSEVWSNKIDISSDSCYVDSIPF